MAGIRSCLEFFPWGPKSAVYPDSTPGQCFINDVIVGGATSDSTYRFLYMHPDSSSEVYSRKMLHSRSFLAPCSNSVHAPAVPCVHLSRPSGMQPDEDCQMLQCRSASSCDRYF